MKRILLVTTAICCLGTVTMAYPASGWRYMDSATPVVVETTGKREQMIPDAGITPTNFMTMAAVTTRFGEPEDQAHAIGQPPITRWYYPAYTVYFEHDRVIISVVN